MKNIILTTDFSDCARNAYSAASSLARKFGAKIHLVHEAEPPPPFYFDENNVEFPLGDYYGKIRRRLEEERVHIDLNDWNLETHLLDDRGAYEKLLEFLEGEEIDLIVISTHGRSGLGRMLLGSFTERVARYAPIPVLTYRKREGATKTYTPRSILVPFDFSENAKAVFPTVRFLQEQYNPKFTFLNVLPKLDEFMHERRRGGFPEEVAKDAASSTRQMLEETCKEVASNVEASCEVRKGVPYEEIVRQAEEMDADLILMATHGWTGLKHFLLGSVAEKVLRRAPCSVLTVRQSE